MQTNIRLVARFIELRDLSMHILLQLGHDSLHVLELEVDLLNINTTDATAGVDNCLLSDRRLLDHGDLALRQRIGRLNRLRLFIVYIEFLLDLCRVRL